jgi:hypothetical protein
MEVKGASEMLIMNYSHYMVCQLIKELLLNITTKTSSLMHMDKHPCPKLN